MNKTPLVSISCITYNHAPYIREALEGFVSQQTDFPFEVLIHDDCSTDGTTEIIREYEAKYPEIIKPMYETENQYSQGKPIGTQVWNLPRAQGKYIALCEGDDYWTDPLKLQKQVDFLESHPDFGMCYGKVKNYIEETRIFDGSFGGDSESFVNLIFANTIPTCTVLIRKDILNRYKNDTQSNGKYSMGDYPMWLYAASQSKIKFINNEFAVYRIVSGSMSHPEQITKWLNFQEEYKKIKLDYLNRYMPEDTILRKIVDNNHMKTILRQRTLYNTELKEDAALAIKNLDCNRLRKIFFLILNFFPPANLLLRLHLKHNNYRNSRK